MLMLSQKTSANNKRYRNILKYYIYIFKNKNDSLLYEKNNNAKPNILTIHGVVNF